MAPAKESTPPHISIDEEAVEGHEESKSSEGPRSSNGWDGKLRLEKGVQLANPEAISDPEYSDEENVHPGETIDPDEGAS